jgi:hypothetical protein
VENTIRGGDFSSHFPDDPELNSFEKIVRFPLDNGQKQPMMWPKVGRSGIK